MVKISKNLMYAEKFIFGILLHVVDKNGKQLAISIGNSVITFERNYRNNKNLSNKNCPNKKFFSKYLYFTQLFIKENNILDIYLDLLLSNKI